MNTGSKIDEGTYRFTMPSGAVTVTAAFKDAPWTSPFADVAEGKWYYDAVRFVSQKGLMTGDGTENFGVNDPLIRAQLVQILYNLEGNPVAICTGEYRDVAAGVWYADAVAWAGNRHITDGYGDGRFGPTDPITREQLAVMLCRYAGKPETVGKKLYFSDADEVNPWAVKALIWAQETGIMQGNNGKVNSKGNATRAHVAQMLQRFCKNVTGAKLA